jgi:hypothetical protein
MCRFKEQNILSVGLETYPKAWKLFRSIETIIYKLFCNQQNSNDFWYVYECESETQ